MGSRSAGWINAHPLSTFVVLAVGITWAAWAPATAASHGVMALDPPAASVLYVVGGAGPMVAAWIVLRTRYGPAAERRLFAPLARWRVHPGWYLLALAGPVVPVLATLAVTGRLEAVLANLGASPAWAWVLLVRLVAAVPEEVAWRGFALPRLQDRYGGLGASLVLGAVWAGWHLPLLLDRSSPMSGYPPALYLVSVVATSVVYTWLFNSTGGSVLILTLAHGAGNAAGDVFLGADTTLWATLQTVDMVLMLALALGAVWVCGPALRAPHQQSALR